MAQRLLVVAHAATPETHASVFGQRGEPVPGEVPQLKGRVVSWFSGPERACQTTAARLGGRAEVIPELRDCDFGEWTGLSLGHVAADDPSGLDAWLRDPSVAPHGGESLADMITRVASPLDEYPWPEGRSVAVVTSLVARALTVRALSASPEAILHIDIGPLGRVSLSRSQRVWRLVRLEPGVARLAD
jgi:broad specificity phosphatase PhoE